MTFAHAVLFWLCSVTFFRDKAGAATPRSVVPHWEVERLSPIPAVVLCFWFRDHRVFTQRHFMLFSPLLQAPMRQRVDVVLLVLNQPVPVLSTLLHSICVVC